MATMLTLPPMLSMDLPENCNWSPTYHTKPKEGNFTKGYEVALFAKTFLTAIRGDDDRVGKPLELTKWQTYITNNIFEVDDNDNLRYREVLLMVPRKNGKTFLAALYLLYHLFTAPTGAEIYSAAGSRDQARLVFEVVKEWVLSSPALSKIITIKDSRSMMINNRTRAFYKALSADAGKAHGLAPYYVICDELAKWDGHSPASKRSAMELLNALQKGSIDRAQSQILMISTAGDFIDEQLLGAIYKRAIAQVEYEKTNPSKGAFGAYIWQAEEGDDYLDPETWRKANPNVGEGLIKIERLEENLESSVNGGSSIATFLRDHLNIWTNSAGEPYVSPVIWRDAIYNPGDDGYKDPFYDGCDVVVGFDASKRGDSSAIVVQTLGTDGETVPGVLKVWELWERPEGASEDWFISRADVEASMVRLHEKYNVVTVWADKFYYEAALMEWQDTYGWDIEFVPQSRERKDRYANEFRADLAEGSIFHLDEPDLNRHIRNTVMDRQEGFSKPPGSSRQKIDLFVAAMLANAGKNFVLNQPEVEEQEVLRF